MKQILWFRRDLRIQDNAILAYAQGEVLPIFIFDEFILGSLPKEDKRVTFIYDCVMKLKKKLKSIGLDLAIFHGKPADIFHGLAKDFDEVLCSVDVDNYATKRDAEIEKIIPLRRFIDSFILDPKEHLKKDGNAYKVFTPFYRSLFWLTSSERMELFERTSNLIKAPFDYDLVPSLKDLGFVTAVLPDFLYEDVNTRLNAFESKLKQYEDDRDYFYKDATSHFSVHLRFGLISPRQLFNYYRPLQYSEGFIRQLFWREFYHYILYHYPQSEFENFNGMHIQWNDNEEDFLKWCEGKTGIPLIDAAMVHLNQTGLMHNRLRMVVASFVTKNLFIHWKKAEQYFALKLLDYEACSNIGSWQWAASTGADAAPYFRVFNPYIQSRKFDKEGIFIKSVLKELEHVSPALFHQENGVASNLFVEYPSSMVDIGASRQHAITSFKRAKHETL
jgi:deoxyribodipyrimidine photo-lyase